MHTKTVATVGGPHPGLLAWLSSSQVDYEIHEHARTQTARQTARAEGVDPRTFAKVVGVRIVDDRDALLVLDAPDQVDLVKARKVLGHETVRLLTESELAALAPDCEVGAIPAVGALFGLPTYADYAVGDDRRDQLQRGNPRLCGPRRSRVLGAGHRGDLRRPRRARRPRAGVGALMARQEPSAESPTSSSDAVRRSWAVVWIDSQEATIGRWVEGRPRIERIHSDVPAHHRATGHVRHDPAIRHGGGGSAPQTAGDPRRLEHLARYLDGVARRLPDDEDLAILGPGTVREHLEHLVGEADAHHRRERTIVCEASAPLSDRQLVARLRRLVGADPVRGTVGAYRWTGSQTRTGSGRVRPPRRVLRKPPSALPEEP